MSNTFHAIYDGTILSQVIEEYAPIISPLQSTFLLINTNLHHRIIDQKRCCNTPAQHQESYITTVPLTEF